MGNAFLTGQSGGGNMVATGEHIPIGNDPYTTVTLNCDFIPDHILLYLYSVNDAGSVGTYYNLHYLLYNVKDNTWKIKGINNVAEYDQTNVVTLENTGRTGFSEVPTFNETNKTFYTGQLSYVNSSSFAARMNYSKNFTYHWIAWKE